MILDELNKSLQTGFIDKTAASDKLYQPKLLVNKRKPPQKVLSTIIEELRHCDGFYISVAFVTSGGVATLMNSLKYLEDKGVRGKIIVSQYLNFTQPEALRKLLKFSNIELRIAVKQNSHSKGYLFKRGDHFNLIIGSSNLTESALATNKEWNLMVSALDTSGIVEKVKAEFDADFKRGTTVTGLFVEEYTNIYDRQRLGSNHYREPADENIPGETITPNSMQVEALENIQLLRKNRARKALLISATGTGKTYLSAFDALDFKAKRLLFVVHRLTIAKKSLKTFETIFDNKKSMGIYSGSQQELDKDFLFATVQTISKQNHLDQFNKDFFDYIVIDESHRSGAASYQRLLSHFEPKFLLGMTATPERTDGEDIFSLFDHNIAFEIRLNRAMEENMLSDFHYYGVSDLEVDGIARADIRDFSFLSSNERVKNILKYATFYGTDNGITRGLVFCSRNEEAKRLSEIFNNKGFKTISLSGENSEEERTTAIDLLESDNQAEKLDYIFTVDIFNEGIDIPKLNQIIMIRPTESAIIFVQQLGRGLRKQIDKGYLTVIDFIANYSNNYLIPIALYGDTSYNKDALRRAISSGSRLIPGSSTINFDAVTKERIYKSINSSNMQLLTDLKKDYFLLKYKLGRTPTMCDFIDHGSRDPFSFVLYPQAKSYYNFVHKVEKELASSLNNKAIKLLELFSNEINNAKRVEESIILKELLLYDTCKVSKLNDITENQYSYTVSNKTVQSCLQNLNFSFIREKSGGKLLTLNEIYDLDIVVLQNNEFKSTSAFKELLQQSDFKNYLLDSVEYAINRFNEKYAAENWKNGFILYQKYSRKDVFHILNATINPVAQNVGGYMVSKDETYCPIFVNYHKEDHISESTKYEDEFINNKEFTWMSKSNRKMGSNDVQSILGKHGPIRLPLFIKKSNDEGNDFYYVGDVEPERSKTEETTMNNDDGQKISVVKFVFNLLTPVSDEMYHYFTEKVELGDKEDLEEIVFSAETENDLEENQIPFYDFYAAAGSFSELQDNKTYELIPVSDKYTAEDGYFACTVLGESMNRRISNGSICLFNSNVTGSRNNKIVLVENFGGYDEDYSSSFTIKTYSSQKASSDNNNWTHTSILLKPNSYDSKYQDILLNEEDCHDMRIVGEFVKVIHV